MHYRNISLWFAVLNYQCSAVYIEVPTSDDYLFLIADSKTKREKEIYVKTKMNLCSELFSTYIL